MIKACDDLVLKKAIVVVYGAIKTKFGYQLIQAIYRH